MPIPEAGCRSTLLGNVARREAETAALLRRLLASVARGELTASTPGAVALLRRLEGAAAALELTAADSPLVHEPKAKRQIKQ